MRRAAAGSALGGEPQETKVDDTYVEYALDVDRVVLVPTSAELPGLLEGLVDPGLGQEAKHELEELLVAAGHDAWMFRVKDWGEFFEARQGQSLAAIREGLKPALDRWYRTRGEEQVIE